jgi:hypothetical protein
MHAATGAALRQPNAHDDSEVREKNKGIKQPGRHDGNEKE